MIKVTFIRRYSGIPAGFSIDTNDRTFRVNDVQINDEVLSDLVSQNVVEIEETDAPSETLSDCDDCYGCDCNDAAERFEPNYNSVDWSKVSSSINEDKSKFVYDEEYVFYNVEENNWKVSVLKKSASHIGRILAGFAVPAGSSTKKMYNRLTNLNKVYNLGLDKEHIIEASGYTPRSAR